jgi:hypothetical protein
LEIILNTRPYFYGVSREFSGVYVNIIYILFFKFIEQDKTRHKSRGKGERSVFSGRTTEDFP